MTQEELDEELGELTRQMHVQIVHLLLLINLFGLYCVTTVMIMTMCSDAASLLWGITMCVSVTVADKKRKGAR